jgi:hypothetical protein
MSSHSMVMTGDAGMGMAAMPGDGMVHMSHEYASWVTALGLAFIAGAVFVRHLLGVLLALACFVALLGIVSTTDLLHHEVNPPHVATHAVLLLAVALILVILRTGRADRSDHDAGRSPLPVDPLLPRGEAFLRSPAGPGSPASVQLALAPGNVARAACSCGRGCPCGCQEGRSCLCGRSCHAAA